MPMLLVANSIAISTAQLNIIAQLLASYVRGHQQLDSTQLIRVKTRMPFIVHARSQSCT